MEESLAITLTVLVRVKPSLPNIPKKAIKDVILTGGNVNYNYTRYSDIDLHLVIDKEMIDCPTVLDDYLQSKKQLWALTHDYPRRGVRRGFEGRFKYVKRWTKGSRKWVSNNHLLLNHIVVIFNCWNDAAIPMFFYKIEPEYWILPRAFLVYLDRILEYPRSTHDIEVDVETLNELTGL